MEDFDFNHMLQQNPWLNESDQQEIIHNPNHDAQLSDDPAPPRPQTPPSNMNDPRPAITALLHFGSQKVTQFIASRIPEQVAKTALTTSLHVAKSSFSIAQTTVTKLKASDIPTHISAFLSNNPKNRGGRKTTWEKLPKEIYKWCRGHPQELRAAGYILAGGMLIYQPSLFMGVLGLRRRGLAAASAATKMKTVVSVASTIPVAMKAVQDLRKSGVGGLGAAALKLAARKMKRAGKGTRKRR